jgi:fluoroquinolone resistance protein
MKTWVEAEDAVACAHHCVSLASLVYGFKIYLSTIRELYRRVIASIIDNNRIDGNGHPVLNRGGIIEGMVLEWTGKEFSHESFEGRELVDMKIRNCRFDECQFTGANMTEIETEYSSFENCDFTDARLNSSVHRFSSFTNCRFRGGNLFLAQFIECKAVGANFTEARVEAITVQGGDWSYANLRHLDLEKLDARGVKFESADFYGSVLKSADLRDCDLRRVNFDQAKLEGVDFRGGQLEGVDLSTLSLKKAKMDMGQAILFAQCHGIVVG